LHATCFVLAQGTRAKPPLISLETSQLKTLNQDIINITAKVMGQGLIVIELEEGNLSATEAFIWPDARTLAAAQLEVLSKSFSE
jgi:hypothetical protein